MDKILCCLAMLIASNAMALTDFERREWFVETCERYADLWLDMNAGWEAVTEWMNYAQKDYLEKYVDGRNDVNYDGSHDSRDN